MKANVLALVLVLLVIIFVGVHFGSQPWTPTRIAGVVIGLPSLALLVLARIQLGGSFSVRPKAQALLPDVAYAVAIFCSVVTLSQANDFIALASTLLVADLKSQQTTALFSLP